MRNMIVVPTSFAFLCCTLTACGSSSEQKTSGLAKALQSSAPVLAAEDALLAAEVKSKLTAADFDTASSVSVSVRKGAATLRGTARTTGEVARLRETAAGVRGISSVVALVKVDPKFRGSAEELRDASLATQVSLNIAEQAGVNVLSVSTRAHDGVVTLEGTVPSNDVKSVMLDAATKTHGVKKVIDKITVSA
jgi:hyperosmotically inducible periplasmic protein